MTNKKMLKATHQGELEINGFKISCAVLENGERVLVNRSVANAFGIKGSGAYWQKKKEQKSAMLPEYLSAKYLQPYISEDHKINLYNTVSYINKSGIETEGVNAAFLSDICDVYVKAGEKGAFKNNADIPANAYNLLLALSKVAIASLVDEVTGYQNVREKDELQKLLKHYISPQLLPWQKRFPDIFYTELFRLNGWDFTVNGIKRRPGVIGTWTKKLIYEELPNGVLSELEKQIPKSETGNKTVRFHQFLTDDIGNPHLTAQINQIVTLFQLSDNMQHMWQQFEKLKARQSGQLMLPFNFDEKGHTIEPKEEIQKQNEQEEIRRPKPVPFKEILNKISNAGKPDDKTSNQ